MTLVLAVSGPESIWLVTDRRLSRGGRPFRDDARKTMFLDTNDGVAMLGYAGLGETRNGTEPADRMSAVPRGRKLPLEKALGAVFQVDEGEINAAYARIAQEPNEELK